MPAFVSFSKNFPWETLSKDFLKSNYMVANVVQSRLSNISIIYTIIYVIVERSLGKPYCSGTIRAMIISQSFPKNKVCRSFEVQKREEMKRYLATFCSSPLSKRGTNSLVFQTIGYVCLFANVLQVIMICTVSSLVFWAVSFLVHQDFSLWQHGSFQEQIFFGLSESQFLKSWVLGCFSSQLRSRKIAQRHWKARLFPDLLCQFQFPRTFPQGIV